MAQQLTLVDGGSYIEIQYDNPLHIITIPKKDIKTKIKRGIFHLYWDGDWKNHSQSPWIRLDWENVISPVVGSAAALRALILGWLAIDTSSSGGASADADYKIGSWDGTVTYASTTTVTLAGAYPTINYNSQVVYIKLTDDTLHESAVFVNGQSGVTIEHAAGVLTIVGAGEPFTITNDFEVGVNSTPVSLDIGSDTTKTTEQAPDYGHYSDVENIISQTNLGIDATHAGAISGTVFDDNASTFTDETIAEGYKIYNITDGCNATINEDTLSGYAGDGGAGTPAADSITSDALAGGVGNDWQVNDIASIPEVKRFVYNTESYPIGSVDVLLDSQDGNNSCYCKIYGTNNSSADDTSDLYWKNLSLQIFGDANGLSADGIGLAARTITEGIYPIDRPTIMLKYMLKIVAENDDGTQDSEFKIIIKKGY